MSKSGQGSPSKRSFYAFFPSGHRRIPHTASRLLGRSSPLLGCPAVHDLLAEFTAQTIDLDEPEHGHDEHDTSLLELNLIDVSASTIMGGFVVSYQSPMLLEAANRDMRRGGTTPLGNPVARHPIALGYCSGSYRT